MARVADAPEKWKKIVEAHGDETDVWTIWCHQRIEDFEMFSYGATAGFFLEGASLEVLQKASHTFREGPMEGEARGLLLVEGVGEGDRLIRGWVLAEGVDLDG